LRHCSVDIVYIIAVIVFVVHRAVPFFWGERFSFWENRLLDLTGRPVACHCRLEAVLLSLARFYEGRDWREN